MNVRSVTCFVHIDGPETQTRFRFDYFANGRVLDVRGLGSRGLFERGAWLAM